MGPLDGLMSCWVEAELDIDSGRLCDPQTLGAEGLMPVDVNLEPDAHAPDPAPKGNGKAMRRTAYALPGLMFAFDFAFGARAWRWALIVSLTQSACVRLGGAATCPSAHGSV